MGWGEPFDTLDRSTGSTQDINHAHELLDKRGIPAGPLSRRIQVYITVAESLIDRSNNETVVS